jgi:hypothetical protein
MSMLRRWALAGTALLAPTMAMFWLDYWRKPGRGKPAEPLFIAGLVCEAGCAALAAPPRPALAALAAGGAVASSAIVGYALHGPVQRLEQLVQQRRARQEFAALMQGHEEREPPVEAIDARKVALIGAIATPAICALIYLGRRKTPPFAPYYGRFAEYRWRRADPTWLSKGSAWGGYALHQLALWACIYAAQGQRPLYSREMQPINWAALSINLAGVALRYGQYRWQYDGLAPDVPEMTSLGSVTFMLALILILEAPRRGIAFGRRDWRLERPFVDFFRRYHGYIFSWSLVYTFWFHPLEPTAGHLAGTAYLLLYLVQSSLLYTQAHLDRRWTTALEMLVVIHAVAAAKMNGGRYTPTFLFGFLATGLISQIHNFAVPEHVRRGLYLLFGGAAVATMARRRSLHRLPDVLHVPILEYGVVGILYGFYLLIRWLRERRSAEL